MDPQEGVETTTGRIPFFMAFLSPIFSGSLFVALNVPLLLALAEGKQFNSLFELMKNGFFPFWLAIIQIQSLISFAILIFGCFVTGLVLSPVERGATFVIASLFARLRRRNRYFSPRMMTDASYSKLVSWLFAHPAEKQHWEWELFLYYLYWSVSINLGIALLLTIMLLVGKGSVFELTAFAAVVALTVAFSLSHSTLMAQVHQLYLERLMREKL
jgi:hypothetical protein